MKKRLNLLRVLVPHSHREEEEVFPPHLRTAPHTANEAHPASTSHQRNKLFFIKSPLPNRRSRRSKAWERTRGHATWDGAQLYGTKETSVSNNNNDNNNNDNDVFASSPSSPLSPSHSTHSTTITTTTTPPLNHNKENHQPYQTPSASKATPASGNTIHPHSQIPNHVREPNASRYASPQNSRRSSSQSSTKHSFSRSVNDVESILEESAIDRNEEHSFGENLEHDTDLLNNETNMSSNLNSVSHQNHVNIDDMELSTTDTPPHVSQRGNHRRATSVMYCSPRVESKSLGIMQEDSYLLRDDPSSYKASPSRLTIKDIDHPEDFPPSRTSLTERIESKTDNGCDDLTENSFELETHEDNDDDDNLELISDNNNNNNNNNNEAPKRRRSRNARYRSLSQEAGDGPDGPMTAMLNACYEGDLETVQYLLSNASSSEQRSKLLQARDTSSFGTPLHKASASDQKDIVHLLLSSGADIEAEDALQSRPLHWAAANGSINAVQVLALFNAQMNVRDRYGYSPLHLSLKNDFLDVTQELTLFRSDINLKRPDGSTAMHLASSEGDLKQVKFLIRHGALTNSRDSAGDTPLFKAVANGHLNIVEELIHADQVSSKRLSIRTDGTPQKLLSRNNNGENILHICARYGAADIMKRAVVRMGPQTLEMLLNEGEKRWEWTPLHLAVVYNQVGCARVMLFIACNPNNQDRNGDTPLHLSMRKGNIMISRALYEHRASVDIKNNQGESVRLMIKRKDISLASLENWFKEISISSRCGQVESFFS